MEDLASCRLDYCSGKMQGEYARIAQERDYEFEEGTVVWEEGTKLKCSGCGELAIVVIYGLQEADFEYQKSELNKL